MLVYKMSEIGNMVISNSLTVLDCVFVTVQIVKLLHLQAVKKEALTHFGAIPFEQNRFEICHYFYIHPPYSHDS